jgi:diacylglycerol kinase
MPLPPQTTAHDSGSGSTTRGLNPHPSDVQQPIAPHAAPGPAVARAGTLARSFRYAFAGIGYCLRTQRNFRIHILAAVLVGGVGLILGITWIEWAILALIVTLVMVAEMINTVVEAAVDLASPTYHPLAKVAKDVAAGAVLLTALGAVVVGACIFLPHILR